MKTRVASPKQRASGYALMMVLFFAGISLMVLATALNWTSSSAIQTERNNRLFTAISAAEAATEKVLSRVTADYKSGGESAVYANLDSYRSSVPTVAESPYWGDFEFNNAQGTAARTYVERVTTQAYVDLNSQYQGLRGWASTYRILSNARELTSNYKITGAVDQDVQVASIPVFQFAIFYGLDLEVNTMTTMNVNGRVHCNGTLYTYPSAPLTFKSDAASGSSYTSRNAASTTVNAAVLTGIVETTNSPAIYSGGVHNLGRFLEDWTSDTFTYNGSMVVLFPSAKATAPFQQPGAYYSPPARNFAFDLNYLDITKQPPGTPEVRAMIRNFWSMPAPNSTNIVAIY